MTASNSCPTWLRAGQGLDPGPGTLHGPLRRPAVEVVADDPLLLPELAGHAGMKMAPEEVKALLPSRRSTTRVLSGWKAETEVTQDGGRPPLGLLGLCLGRAQHHEVVRIADDFSGATFGPGPVEGVQVDVGEER